MKKLVGKWKQMPNSVKASIAFVFCTLLIKGLFFLVTPIFTRVMAIDDYGIVTTYNSWLSIIEIFAVLGLTSAGVFNVGLKDNKDTRDEYISSCIGLCNITTLIFFIVLFILKIVIGDAFILDNELLIVMFIHFWFSPAQIFWITRQRYEYKYKLVVVISILSAFISQIASIVGVLLIKHNVAFNKIIGNELGTLIFTIPIYIYLIVKGKSYKNFKLWKNIFLLSLPLIPHYLSQHILASSDKIMISQIVKSGDAAIYEVATNISLIGTIFWNAVNSSLMPYMFEKIETKEYDKIRILCKKLLIGYGVLLTSILLIAPEILKILAPENYYEGIYCIAPLMFGIFLSALYNFFANVEFFHKKTKEIAVSTVIATFVNVILNVIFIRKYSYIAASYTTLLSTIVLVFLHYLNYKKTETNNIFDIKFILIISILLFLIFELCNLLYLNNILRYIFIICLFIVVLLKRKIIVEIIKKIKNNT